MSDREVRAAHDGDVHPVPGHSIDELLDRAVAAINRGDRSSATALAARVLAVDVGNTEAEDLLAYRPAAGGEIRRLTILFADLVDSTVLSTQVEPETYRLIVGTYQELVQAAVDRFEGHVPFIKGDGLLAVFGHPIAHEDDVRRAVHAGLEITREVARLSEQARRRFGIDINVRVGVHRGLVYLDTAQDDVYGLAANLAARVSGLAPPGAVVVSDTVEMLIRNDFELEPRRAALVKGVEEPITHYRVVAERARPPKSGQCPLVGRDRELAQLERSWAQAKARTLSTPGVAFRGEAGIGKSRLAAAAAGLAEASGSVVLELVGSPFHTDAGLYPIRTLLERRCGIDRNTDEPERLRLLDAEVRDCGLEQRSTVPLLAPVLGIEAQAGYEPVAAEGRKLYELIAQAVQKYLLASLAPGAGLVVAEDVHWFDPSTREVLGALLDAAGGGLLVVMTGRPGDWLPDSWPHEVFDLASLTDAQTDKLIVALNPGLPADRRTEVARRCDGVPFYIEQLVNGLSQTGVPEALYEPLFARLRASPKVVPVVEAAAVIGREVDRTLLSSVVDRSDDEIADVIDELEDALVLEPWGADGWRFRHELLREVAAELAPPSVRRGLHAKVANALIGAVEPEWALVADHYQRADRFDEAAAAYQQASAEARRRGALAEARTYLTRALAQLDNATPGPDRDHREIAVRLERGNLTSAADGYQSRAAAADFERCLQLSGTDLRNDELFSTLAVLPGYYVTRGDVRGLVRVIESLRTGLEGRPWFGPVIEMLLGWVAWLRGEFDAAVSDLEAATAGLAVVDQQKVSSERFRVNEPLAYAHIYLASARVMRGDLTGADTELAHAACGAETLGFPLGPNIIAYALTAEIGMRIEAGQLELAAVLAADLGEKAELHDFDEYRLWATTQQAAVSGLVALDGDHIDQAVLAAHITTMTGSLDVWRTVGLLMHVTFYDAVLGRLLIAASRKQEARERLDASLELAQDTGMHFYDAELLRLRAQTHDDPAARQADINAAIELGRRQGATLFELRSALDDFELRGEPARAGLTAAVSLMPTDSAMPELARARAAMS